MKTDKKSKKEIKSIQSILNERIIERECLDHSISSLENQLFRLKNPELAARIYKDKP